LAKFKVFETNQFLSDLGQDFSGQNERIRKKLETYVYPQIRENPHFGKNIKKLKDYTLETWRYKVGDYRFFYTINTETKLISMLTIDHRQEAYWWRIKLKESSVHQMCPVKEI